MAFWFDQVLGRVRSDVGSSDAGRDFGGVWDNLGDWMMRVRVDGNGHVSQAGLQASHALGSLATANGLVDVPAGAVIEQGATVRVLRFCL